MQNEGTTGTDAVGSGTPDTQQNETFKEKVEAFGEKIEEKFEEFKGDVVDEFNKVIDAIGGEDKEALKETPGEDPFALKTASDPAHDSVTANGGQITNLNDDGTPVKEVEESADEASNEGETVKV